MKLVVLTVLVCLLSSSLFHDSEAGPVEADNPSLAEARDQQGSGKAADYIAQANEEDEERARCPPGYWVCR